MNAKLKRVLKNTVFLYVRMFLLMFISLFSTRIVLSALGAEDYGIYNVVCGFVVMLTFLNGAMANASQRFISYEIEKNNFDELSIVFSHIKKIHVLIAIIILFLGESIGLWFVNSKLNLPEARMFAINIVYQCSLISTFLTILSIPYSALIIAHENMKIFAYVGVFEGAAKLLIAYLLLITSNDRLILYGILLAFIAVIVRFFLTFFCKRSYKESFACEKFDLIAVKKIIAFAGWSLFGNISSIANSQGINILVNIFFGTITNAARGISYQVDSAIRSFIANFQTALNPQIVKSYSAGNLQEMYSLIFLGSKMSFFIMFILAMPIYVNIEYLLEIWLVNVPEYTIMFTRLILVNSLIITFSGALSIAIQATGNICAYQVCVGTILLLNIPISYILYKIGYAPYSAVAVSIIIESVLLFIRLFFLKKMIQFKINEYVKKVLLPSICCFFCSFPFFSIFMHYQKNTLAYFIISFFSCLAITCSTAFFIGLTKMQKKKIFLQIKNKIFKENILCDH